MLDSNLEERSHSFVILVLVLMHDNECYTYFIDSKVKHSIRHKESRCRNEHQNESHPLNKY